MFKEKLHQALQALSSTISTFSESDVCDELACDFFANRLPPFGYNGDPVGKCIIMVIMFYTTVHLLCHPFLSFATVVLR